MKKILISVLVLVFMTFLIAPNKENEKSKEKRPIILIDSSLEVDIYMFNKAEESVCKRISSVDDITSIDRNLYSERSLVVSSENASIIFMAKRLGYKVVEVK